MPRDFSRSERIGKAVMRELANIIDYELQDPRIGYVTLTAVKVTGDLSLAKVYFTCSGTSQERRETTEALNHAKSFLRSQLAQSLPTRTVPSVTFVYDKSIEHGQKIEALLEQVQQRTPLQDNSDDLPNEASD